MPTILSRGQVVKDVYLDPFTYGYCLAAMFTEDENPPRGEYPADRLELLTRNSLMLMAQDCERFQADHTELIEQSAGIYGREHAGRDYWYTRNGHGCGYWEGDLPEELGDALTAAAKSAGESYLHKTGRFYSL